eukprot:scaffold24600_cov78-Skeletonema_dohrnii-CCMP3373.AAC.1
MFYHASGAFRSCSLHSKGPHVVRVADLRRSSLDPFTLCHVKSIITLSAPTLDRLIEPSFSLVFYSRLDGSLALQAVRKA